MGVPKNKSPKITKKEEAEVEKLLNNLEHKNVLPKKRKNMTLEDKQHVQKAIQSVLSEYMDCYILIGYDLSEGPIMNMEVNSPMQQKAVLALLGDIADDLLDPGMPPEFLDD